MNVLIDACVLYPTVLREGVLAVAQAGLLTPLWSERILEEWARAARKLGPQGEAVARGEIALLRAAWPAASVPVAYDPAASLWLPDPDDVHVLSAAITGQADALMTLNIKDFPKALLAEHGVDRVTPDEMLIDLYATDQEVVTAAVMQVHAQAERLAGTEIPLRALLKKARLPRLGKAIATAAG